jgi:lipopolysaccharide/colanic/teichoic acid biosynthesis glycosyltransferase
VELAIVHRPQVFPYQKAYHVAKRIMDLALCLLILPFALPLIGLLALLIRLDSPGPALFVQMRIGHGGRPFRMYKFRTMTHNLDDSFHRSFMKAFVKGQIGDEGENGANRKKGANGDAHSAFAKAFVNVTSHLGKKGNRNGRIYKPIQVSQVTRVGRILRKTSLDELPQIFNVLKGEMSLVGPRPNVPWEVEEYQPWHYERLEVLPGITGLAQVEGRSSISFDTIVEYDIEYIEKQDLALDLRILWRTVSSVIYREGAS